MERNLSVIVRRAGVLAAAVLVMLTAPVDLGGTPFPTATEPLHLSSPLATERVAASAASSPAAALNGSLTSVGWVDGVLRSNHVFWQDSAYASDPVDGGIVQFGGDAGGPQPPPMEAGTWFYGIRSWTNLTPLVSPPVRLGAAMAFDSTAGAVVMFGGLAFTRSLVQPIALYNDTWEFTRDTGWVNVTRPGPSPPPSVFAAMADDPTDHGVLLFGGESLVNTSPGIVVSNGTWLWSSGGWQKLAPAASPPARSSAGLAPDGTPGQELLFGGESPTNSTANTTRYWNDSWVFDHGTWTNATSSLSPPAATYAYDLAFSASAGGAVAVTGPFGQAGLPNETWIFASGHWSDPATNGSAPPGGYEIAVEDPTDDSILDTPLSLASLIPPTYSLTGRNWSLVPANDSILPPFLWHTGVGYDPGTRDAVMFGGVDVNLTEQSGTWLLTPNATWSMWNSTGRVFPDARESPGFAFDSTANESILFGGSTTSADDRHLFSYRDGGWSDLGSASAPPAELYGCLADDPANAGVLLFGGLANAASPLDETYVWNATGWHDLNLSVAPLPRGFSSCAWDPAVQAVLLVGGATASSVHQPAGTIFSDTWAFDGRSWHELATDGPGSTGSSDGQLVAYGPPAAPRMLLLPGWNGNGISNGSWRWNGSAWATDPLIHNATPRWEGAGALDDPALGGPILLAPGVATTATGRVTELLELWAALDDLELDPSVSVVGDGSGPAVNYSVGALHLPPPAAVAWSFGDGATSSLSNGTHRYPDNSSYRGSLTVRDGWGARASWSFGIEGTNLSIPSFDVAATLGGRPANAVLSGAAPLSLEFRASASGNAPPFRYVWDFGDGSSSGQPNGSHTFSSPGTFSVGLIVTDGSGARFFANWTAAVAPLGTTSTPPAPGSNLEFLEVGGVLAAVAVVGAGVVAVVRRRRPGPPPSPTESEPMPDGSVAPEPDPAATDAGPDG